MKKNRKNKTKSLLACAVLASVLAGGMPSVQAAQVNALVMPKDFATLIGKSIAFGQQRGYVENQQLSVTAEAPTWQIATVDNGSISLLANEAWGKNRVSDTNWYDPQRNPGSTVHQWYYREALQYLNENVSQFFSDEELRILQNQTSVEEWYSWLGNPKEGKTEYSGIFALPTTGQVEALGADKRKREFSYWLADGYKYRKRPDGETIYCQVNTVQPDGSIVPQAGENAKHIYPTIALNKPLIFAYYGDKTLNHTFSSQYVSEPSTISSKNLTFKDTDKEKNVNITKLNVTQDGIVFDANGLATGAGQGIGGLVENAAGNYLAYARLEVLADNDNGTAENVEIKFDDTSITGNNTIHLFNEWLGDKYDLAGNFENLDIALSANKVTGFKLSAQPNIQELTVGNDVQLSLEGDRNFKKLTVGDGEFKYTAVNIEGAKVGGWNYTECQAVKVTEALNWANVLQAQGEIILKGSFSVEDGTLTLVRPTNTYPSWNLGIDGWNDIIYNGTGTQSATLKAKGKMHGLYVNGGTFTAENDLALDEYLRVNNGAVVNLSGESDLTINSFNLNGTLNMTTANKTLTVQNDLTAAGEAKITGNGSAKLEIGGNLTAQGDLTLENITLDKLSSAEENNIQIQVQGNLSSNADISANSIEVQGGLSAEKITSKNVTAGGNVNVTQLNVSNVLNLTNGKEQNGTIGTLTFGDVDKTAIYAFDVGKDKLTISTSASGNVKLVPKYGTALTNGATVDVFTGGDLSGLTLQDARVTDMANQQTYLLKQDETDKGKLEVIATRHNAVVNFADPVKGQKVVFGNYWQENTDAKQPVLWSYVKQDNGQPIFLSDKILANTGGVVYVEMYKIINFLKTDGAFVKDLFTASEVAILNITNGDALGLPSFDDVKDGGNYGWDVNGRKAQVTSYAGNGGRNYALSSTHFYYYEIRYDVNDWVDSQNGNIGNRENTEISTYGIRPTISFDTIAVLFATNADGGKGSVGEGNLTRLQDVGSNSTLELTLDDAYITAQKGTDRVTGDIALSSVALDGSSVSVGYSGAKYVDNNSFVSLLIGEGNMPQDYFGYGKTKAGTEGSGTLTVDLGSFYNNRPTGANDANGYALTFFNEQGNGTSLAGKFNVLPGVLKLEGTGTDKYLRYTVVAGDVAQDIEVGKNNVVELKGSGTTVEKNTLTKNITGEGKVLVVNSDHITANGNYMQADFETTSNSNMKISGGDVKGSLKGNFTLTGDTTFSGKSLQGKITSSSTEKLTLNNDVQINRDLEITNLDGNGKTLDMQQKTGTVSYNALIISKLRSNANWAIDVGKYNGTDTFTSDKIYLYYVDTDKKITLNAINLVDDPQITVVGAYKDIFEVVNGGAADNVVVADGLKVYGSNYVYKASKIGSTIRLTCDSVTAGGFKGFIKSDNSASYSFRDAYTSLDGEDVTTGSDGSTENLTKTVFMNGKTLNGTTKSITINGSKNHTLSMMNGEMTNFATALKVENGGTLILENVRLWGNTTDVQNYGIMNIRGTVKMDTLTGSGTTELVSNSILNLGDATATDPQTFEQTFTGYGLLNFMGNTSVAVTKLGTVTDKIAVTIAENKTLSLTGSGTLYNTIKGEGKINIASGNSITTNASNLQADVVNDGTLTIGVDNTGKVVGSITDTAGSGTNGTLVIAKNTIVEGKIAQNNVTVNENATLDVYQNLIATSSIINNGSIFIDTDNLKSNVTNSANGAVYLRNLGTEASKTLNNNITNGKVIVMNDVKSSLQKFVNTEVCLAGGTNLTLEDSGTYMFNTTIKGYGTGTGTLITDCNGMAGTDNYYTATFDNIQVPLVNRGTLELNKGSTPGVNMMTGKMDSITNSGTLSIGADITLDRNISNSGTLNINGCLFSGEMTNSGTVTFKRVEGATTSVCTITGTINNSGTVEIKEGNTFDTTAKVIGGILNLKGDYTFSNDNIQGLTELYVDGATYNFNAELGATPSVELIDAEKVTGTLKLGAVTATSNETLSEWELGETKTAQYLADNTENTVVVGNTAVVFSGDNYRFTFSQAKEADGTTNKIGYLGIIKENGGELWQIVRNTEVSGYHCGNVSTYSLTGDYTEQMKDATTDTDKLGTLTPVSPATSRTLTIDGNGHFFAGNGKNGITVGNADDVLNFNNISEIKNWNSYIVTNNGGTVNFNNVTKLSSPVINTSGTVNFNGTTEVNNTLSGSGTFNNNGELTITNVNNLSATGTLNNTGIVKIGDTGILNTKIDGGTLEVLGTITVDAAKLAVNEIDIDEGKSLTVTGSTLGEMTIANLGTLSLTVATNNAFAVGGTVNINSNMTTSQSILANEINLGTNTLTVTGTEDTTEFGFGKINANDSSELNITKGKVTAYDEINSKIILGANVDLTIAADNIKKSVEIGTNANLNLGDGTFASSKISGTNSGTVNFVGNVKVDGSLSLPKVTFANGSTTTLTVTAGGDAPLQVTDTISVDSGAKLYVNGAEKGETYKIVSGDAIEDNFTGWTLDNIRGEDATGRNVKAKSFAVDSNVYSIVFKSALPENTDLGKLLENADGTPLADWAEKVCDYFDTAYGDAGEAYTANAINSMASASVLAGAQKGAATMVTQVAGNISANVGVGARPTLSGVRGQVSGVRNVSADVNDSASMRIDTVEQGKASEVMPTEYKDKVYDKQVWASYIHSKQKIDGLKAGSLTQNSTIQLNGVTVGADLWSGKKSFGGLAITYADGNANSAQMSNSTKNEAKYYGISMYHRQDMGKYALTTDIGYTYNKNDITQHTTGITDEVTSKPKTHAYTVGMKLEREIYLSKACKIVPFAGARYTRLQNRDFSNSLGANTKVDNQNLVTVPVGLSFHSHLITTEGWKLGSILEGGYEWNFGNRHSTQEFGYGGAYNSIGFDVVDRGQYFVKAALTADYENMFFELGYRYSKGKSVRDNKWNFNANFIF